MDNMHLGARMQVPRTADLVESRRGAHVMVIGGQEHAPQDLVRSSSSDHHDVAILNRVRKGSRWR
jgi:hypothetical protein